MEKATLKGFHQFCKNNILLISAVTFTLFFTYGIKLFQPVIGTDTEFLISNKNGQLRFLLQLGRFWQTLLIKLLFPFSQEWNPYTEYFIAFCMIWFFTISWCYLLSIFNKKAGVGDNYLIPFALILMTMPNWVDILAYGFTVGEIALMISVCPYTVYLFYKGFLDNEKKKIAIAFILLVLMMATYQALACMFCCGVFACFLLLQEQTDYEPKVYRNLCKKLFISLIGAVVCYFIIYKSVLFVLRIEETHYFDSFTQWSGRTAKEVITKTFLSVSIVNNIFKAWRNPFLFPITAVFLAKMIYTMIKTIPPGRRLLYFLAGIGIPLSVLFVIIARVGTLPPVRTLFALPLAIAFMLFYVMKTNKKKIAVVVAGVSLVFAFFQSQYMSQILYTDQTEYNDQVHLAYKLEKLINQVQPPERKLPIAFIGYYLADIRFRVNWLEQYGALIGRSFFSSNWWDPNSPRETTFMATLGINFYEASTDQEDWAMQEAIWMPPYPNPNCVRNVGDFIIVRLPEMKYMKSYVQLERMEINKFVTIAELDIPGDINPYIYLPIESDLNRPSGLPFIEITYSSNVAGNLEVLYDYGYGFSAENYSRGGILGNFEENKIILQLKNWYFGSPLAAIRINPPGGAEFTIKNLKILSGEVILQ